MPTKPERIYWDRCVYISCIEETPGRYPVLREVLRDAESGTIVLVASALVIAEVVKLENSSEPAAKQADLIRDFFENDYIHVRALDRAIAEEAVKISRTHGIKPPDAIHIATALRWECSCLQTYDGEDGDSKKLLAFDRKIGWPALPIALPSRRMSRRQPSLFDTEPPPSPPQRPPAA